MNIDMEEIRDVLRAIPGTTVVEMEHSREKTMCCGCRAVATLPEVGKNITDLRLNEALATGANKLLDVCHHCHWVLLRRQMENGTNDFDIENYSTYILSALGHKRPDSANIL
jgi:Fe-S oxidoreductase